MSVKTLMLKRRVEIKSGVQWTGFNLMEIQMFLGVFEGFPKTEAQHLNMLETQDRLRTDGFKVPTYNLNKKPFKEVIVTAHVGDWIVSYSNHYYGVCPDKTLRYEYDILEETF